MILKGKNIIITGAGRGIGKAVAIACAREGANIAITSRNEDELKSVKEEIEKLNSGVKVIIKIADITKYPEVEECFKKFKEEIGSIDAVIANAGASRRGASHEFDPDTFSMIILVNILGVFNSFKAAYPLLKKDDKKNPARFIITGSAAYPNAMPQFAAYTASKYGVVGLLKEFALEYKKDNINFTAMLPTMVDTKLLRGSKAGDGNKAPGVMDPDDLNKYYIFLLSDSAARVNNELLITSDIQTAENLLKEAPVDKKENWNTMKEYLEQTAPKALENVKKLGKLFEFLIKK